MSGDDLTFEGFGQAAFEALAALREHPTVVQARRDRDRIRGAVLEPFGRYRDDLVVHWVIPAGLPFETERNVFSRIPRNDFGAGGAHHHVWMAFYRPPRKRLTDVQLLHSIDPDGFTFGLYIGARSGALFAAVRARLAEDPPLALLNSLLSRGYALSYATAGVTRRSARPPVVAPLAALPPDFARAQALWITRKLPRQRVIDLGPDLVREALRAMQELEALYRWMLDAGERTVGPPSPA